MTVIRKAKAARVIKISVIVKRSRNQLRIAKTRSKSLRQQQLQQPRLLKSSNSSNRTCLQKSILKIVTKLLEVWRRVKARKVQTNNPRKTVRQRVNKLKVKQWLVIVIMAKTRKELKLVKVRNQLLSLKQKSKSLWIRRHNQNKSDHRNWLNKILELLISI